MPINKQRIDVEHSIITSVLTHPEWKAQISLNPKAFSGHREVIVKTVNNIQASQLTEVSLENKLSKRSPKSYGGMDYVKQLWSGDQCKVFNDVQILYDELLDFEARDRIKDLSFQMMTEADIHKLPRTYMLEIAGQLLPLETDYNIDLDKTVKEMFDAEQNFLKSYIPVFDEKANGIEHGEFMIIGGSPGMGKTSVALHMFRENINHDVPAAYFSLEMTDRQILMRMIAQQLNIPILRLRNGNLDDVERRRIKELMKSFKSKEFTIDCKSRNLTSIVSRMRTLVEQGYGAIYIDYLQLMKHDSGRNREQDVATISRELNDVAKTTQTPVIALSQLSRAHMQRQNKRPMLSDLRESGSIEQDADIVMFPFRPNYFEVDSLVTTEPLELIIAKGRNIGTGTLEVKWDKQHAKLDF